jgi:hypothetical protein
MSRLHILAFALLLAKISANPLILFVPSTENVFASLSQIYSGNYYELHETGNYVRWLELSESAGNIIEGSYTIDGSKLELIPKKIGSIIRTQNNLDVTFDPETVKVIPDDMKLIQTIILDNGNIYDLPQSSPFLRDSFAESMTIKTERIIDGETTSHSREGAIFGTNSQSLVETINTVQKLAYKAPLF